VRLVLAALIAILVVALSPDGPGRAIAQRNPSDGQTCPTNAQGLQQPAECVCTAPATTSMMVWGTDVYTDDSNICAAALHAGVVGPAGGGVRVLPRAGLPAFRGSTRNGVTTLDYGPWERAFTLERSDVKAAIDPDQCPADFQGFRGHEGALSCNCSAAQTLQGGAWGTDVYTDDSSVCLAAVHAGAIPPTGGPVRVLPTRGRQSYAGTTRNGVTTQSFGRWPNAFRFAK
jgi:hypothetical protein